MPFAEKCTRYDKPADQGEFTFLTSIGPAGQNMKDQLEKRQIDEAIKAMKFKHSLLGKFNAAVVKPLFAKFQPKK